tara:strand:- start:667 stop:1569 length:903 start_codon:yes stop_codon:yes gene_type:complete
MEIKYDNQDREWLSCISDKKRADHSKNWLKQDNLDYWRHQRMLNPLMAFINKKDKWLTLGDGRYGSEANFLINKGVDALATDFSDHLLKKSKEIGFIHKYKKENAENLSFKDNEFDYVLIKEALHHFPRPWLALYEAFRVCKKGVIIIEPNDQNSCNPKLHKKFFNLIINLYKVILRHRLNKDGYGFEEVGNFIYTTNNRELEKFLLGMHFNKIAHKKLNDHYIKGIEYLKLNNKSVINRFKILSFKLILKLKDFLNLIGLIDNSLNLNMLFKEDPEKETIKKMVAFNWEYKELPNNPYI